VRGDPAGVGELAATQRLFADRDQGVEPALPGGPGVTGLRGGRGQRPVIERLGLVAGDRIGAVPAEPGDHPAVRDADVTVRQPLGGGGQHVSQVPDEVDVAARDAG
jgi:hypothetical protein